MQRKKTTLAKLRDAQAHIKTLTTQLEDAQIAADLKVSELEKKLASEKASYSNLMLTKQEMESELKQINALIDVLPGSVARETDECNTWDRTRRNVLTRLTAWLIMWNGKGVAV